MLNLKLDCWDLYSRVLASLSTQHVEYAIAGGVAVNLHGIHRPTSDLDLLVGLQPDNLERFISTLQQLGFVPRLPVPASWLLDPAMRDDWIVNKNMLAFTFWNPQVPMSEVDFLLAASRDHGILERAFDMQCRGAQVRVVSIDDLVKLKRESDRPHDGEDADALIGLRK